MPPDVRNVWLCNITVKNINKFIFLIILDSKWIYFFLAPAARGKSVCSVNERLKTIQNEYQTVKKNYLKANQSRKYSKRSKHRNFGEVV